MPDIGKYLHHESVHTAADDDLSNVLFCIPRRPLREARYETEKSHIAFWSSLSKCLHV